MPWTQYITEVADKLVRYREHSIWHYVSWSHKQARILTWLALFVYDFCFPTLTLICSGLLRHWRRYDGDCYTVWIWSQGSFGEREGKCVRSSDYFLLATYWRLEHRIQAGRFTLFLKTRLYFVLGRFFLKPYATNLCVGVSITWIILNRLIHAET